MQAPENERMRLLGVAICRATQELRAPIDRIEVTDGHVTCRAGGRAIAMTYRYAQGGDVEASSGRFIPMPGSGEWEVEVGDGPIARRRWSLAAALRGMLRKPG
jgi:hypothetical protein